MTRSSKSAILALTLMAFALPAMAAAQATVDARPGVAVLPFTNGGSYGPGKEDMDALQVGLQSMMLTELAQNSALRIVDRGKIRDLMAEQDLGATGRVDAETAARIGKIVGARYVVTGGFVDLFGDFRLDSRIVDVETTEVLKAQQVQDKREKMYGMIVDLAQKVTADAKLPELPKQIREERKAREIPAEAMTLYSRAQVYQDGGQKDRAEELYKRITQKFPQMTEAREALKQLQEG
jgi:TolB-like protein